MPSSRRAPAPLPWAACPRLLPVVLPTLGLPLPACLSPGSPRDPAGADPCPRLLRSATVPPTGHLPGSNPWHGCPTPDGLARILHDLVNPGTIPSARSGGGQAPSLRERDAPSAVGRALVALRALAGRASPNDVAKPSRIMRAKECGHNYTMVLEEVLQSDAASTLDRVRSVVSVQSRSPGQPASPGARRKVGSSPAFGWPPAQPRPVPLSAERLDRAVPDPPGARPVASHVEEVDRAPSMTA